MVALIKAAQLLLSLSILVVLHELGHYWAARAFKTRVEKFYLFMNPWFSIFKKKIGETEWGLGWLPLGGYVKIAGMIDESMDTEQMAKPPQPWEFRSKPAWQRLIIMLGGIIMNLILAFVIYAGVLFYWGETKIHNTFHLDFHPALEELGFEDGDRILQYNGEYVPYYGDLTKELFRQQVTSIQVERDGKQIPIALDKELGQILIDEGIKSPFEIMYPCVVQGVMEGSPAQRAGLMAEDSVVAVGNVRLPYFSEVQQAIKDNPSTNLELTVYRNGEKKVLEAMTNEDGTLGFEAYPPDHFESLVRREHIEYGFFESIGAGYTMAWTELQSYVQSMRFLFTKSGATQVGSLGTFATMFDDGWDWYVFWTRTAFLSLVLAFMNLLPIPALDGGHVMFTLYEMIAGKPAPQKFLERAQMVGIVLLLSLMIYALGNDFVRLFTGGFS